MSQNVTEPNNNSFRVHSLGSFRFDVLKMLLRDESGNLVKLRAQTGRVLKYLIENADKPVSKTELIEAIWSAKFVTDDSLTQCISEIRRKIEDKDHRIIETFPKIGYQLNSSKKNQFEIDVNNRATQLNLIIRPIEDVSTGIERGYLGNAIFEEIRVGLSQCCDFSLATLPAGKVGDDIGMLADKHQIHYVLEGSQQKIGNRIRVTARLIDAHSQRNIWARVYERDLENSRMVQMEIVERIVVAASAEMAEGLPSAGLAENCAIYLNLKSRPLARRLTAEANLQAKKLNIMAVENEPQSPYGHLGLAVYYHLECVFSWCKPSQRAEFLRQGILHSQRAIELDSGNEIAHRMCAQLHLQQGDTEQALQRLNISNKINPNNPSVREHIADVFSLKRQTETALRDIENSNLNARYPKPEGWLDSLHCWLLWRNGDYQQTLERFQRRPLVPIFDYLILAATYACLGRLEEARRSAQSYLAEFPKFSLAQERETEKTEYKNPQDLERWLNALSMAGVPDIAPVNPNDSI